MSPPAPRPRNRVGSAASRKQDAGPPGPEAPRDRRTSGLPQPPQALPAPSLQPFQCAAAAFRCDPATEDTLVSGRWRPETPRATPPNQTLDNRPADHIIL